jgi:hypothetical protein
MGACTTVKQAPLLRGPLELCRESNPDLMLRQTRLGPKRHHALDHASQTTSGRDAEN